jgi:nonribosomal peptide synthetase DhbF
VATATAKFDLSVSLSEERAGDGSPAGIIGGIEYASDLFDRASVEALAGRFVRLLEGAVAAPGRALGQLEILGGEERATSLREWNATSHALPCASLPELFAAQVAKSPDGVAVIFEQQQLSYGELDRRANALAHHLRAHGVGPETVVGLCLARRRDDRGAARDPVARSSPPTRTACRRASPMLGDAGARVLVTQAALLDRLLAETRAVDMCGSTPMRAIAQCPPRPAVAPTRSTPPRHRP